MRKLLHSDFEMKVVAKARPRATIRNGMAVMYTPATTKQFESAVAKKARDSYGLQGAVSGPISIAINIYKSIPVSWPSWKKALAEAGIIYPTAAPDNDNYEKAIWDALTGIVYIDDAQIVDNCMTIRYGDRDYFTVIVHEIDGVRSDIKRRPE